MYKGRTLTNTIRYGSIAIGVLLLLAACQNNDNTLFKSLSPNDTKVSFTNTPASHERFNILYYLYYYNGGGVAIGDINNDGLPDLYFTANSKAHNKLYLNKGDFKFEDITEKAGVAGKADWCTGATLADINGDGLLDIYVSTISGKYDLTGHNELYINKGNNQFTEAATKFGLDTRCLTTQSAFFDYDHDGDLDCYILNQSHHPHANIVDTINRRRYDSLSGDRLYRNDVKTKGTFTDVSATAGIYQSNLGYGLGLAIADLNNDGWDDIYIGNDFHENDYYYVNNGNGSFTESGARHFKHYSRFSMGNDIADYNNDGQLDIITTDMLPDNERILKTYGSDENPDTYKVKLDLRGYQKQYSKNALQRNNGNGNSFSETSLISGVSATDWSWSPLFADFDNDGKKDLFISSGIVKRPVDLDYIRFVSDLDMQKGRQQTDAYDEETIKAMPDGASHPYLFKGDGEIKFTDKSKEWGTARLKGYHTGAAYADLNNDGNLDIVINSINSPAFILKNQAPPKTTLDIAFKGADQNTTGIGAKAWVFTGNTIQYQQLMPTRGFQSASDTKLHFGLDSIKYIDSILIVWPNQKMQWLKNVPAKGYIEVKQAEAGGQFQYSTWFPDKKPAFSDITATLQSPWTHRENDFLDYNRQYLIPHLQSIRGPKIAVADVNNDQLDDLYACGAAGQPGTLLLQTTTGTFVPADTALFNTNAACEEIDALFFDANKDGYPDLYVASGGNQFPDNSPELNDHFYLNNGRGKFSPADTLIPQIKKNKSCITAADIDQDGDTDLFLGILADAKEYGTPQTAYLLLNNGQGQFSIAKPDIISLDSLGIVTSARFADCNNDGWADLIVAGEWMSVNIFMNRRGQFIRQKIPNTTGLWQCLYTTDLNGDGYTDILAGNWGYNNKFYPGKNGPLKLYVKDFDQNGSVEQILAYTIDGKEYPFFAKDELERPLPVLKKAYLKYDDVAGKTVDYIFYDLFTNYRALQAETLGSTAFLNDGKGQFTPTILPWPLQLSPIFSFARVSDQILAGGNFYGVVPYEGQYDALLPTLFSFNNTTKKYTVQERLPFADGEVRDIQWIRQANGKKIIVIAQNNKPLVFLRPAY
jgi:enediyne biosynthesis protein E4